MTLIARRTALLGLAGAGAALGGCSKIFGADQLVEKRAFSQVLDLADAWTLQSQRFLLSGGQLAQEFKASDISPQFKANGTTHPGGDDYARAVDETFANW